LTLHQASAAKMAARAPPLVATEPEAAAQKQNTAAAEVEKRAKSPEVITLSHMKKSQSQSQPGKGKRAPPAPDMGDGQADAKRMSTDPPWATQRTVMYADGLSRAHVHAQPPRSRG
jgi:hypothetical protein